MAAKHTPGPWVATNRLTIIDANGEFVADAAQVSFAEDGDFCLPTAEPNARLIAAAPDFYAASASTVERMADLPRWLRSNGGRALAGMVEEEIERHRAALAKAEG